MIASRRVSLLLATADYVARTGGIDPVLHADKVAASWRAATDAQHRELALLAGMRPVDGVVRGQFLDALDGRAARVRDERDPAHNGRPATGPHSCRECGSDALDGEELCESCAFEEHRSERLEHAEHYPEEANS